MSQNNTLSSLATQNEAVKRKILKSLKARADARRSLGERVADIMTSMFGSMTFLFLNGVFFLLWILINLNFLDSIPAFDPYPFNLLTMVVSLQAIFLAIFVLISQNRSVRIDDLRQETELQINLITEREITKVIKMIILVLEKQGVDVSSDSELKKMLVPVDEKEIEQALEKEIF